MSGRPPPEPPTFCATGPMILPAWTRLVKSLVTPTMSVTLPSVAEPKTTTPEPSLSRSWSTSVRICGRSRLSTRWASTLTPDVFDLVVDVRHGEGRRLHAGLVEFTLQALDLGFVLFQLGFQCFGRGLTACEACDHFFQFMVFLEVMQRPLARDCFHTSYA